MPTAMHDVDHQIHEIPRGKILLVSAANRDRQGLRGWFWQNGQKLEIMRLWLKVVYDISNV